jgi:hypothetical protein
MPLEPHDADLYSDVAYFEAQWDMSPEAADAPVDAISGLEGDVATPAPPSASLPSAASPLPGTARNATSQ